MTARILLLASLGTALFTTAAEARPRPDGQLSGRRFEANKTFGLGLELGSPTGLNVKYFLSGDRAIDAGLGRVFVNYGDRIGFHVYGDYLWHPVSITGNETFELPFYVGVGVRLWDFEDRGADPRYSAFAVGARVPLGLSFDFNTVPLDIFVQLVPTLDFSNSSRQTVYLDIDASFGIRYWFN